MFLIRKGFTLSQKPLVSLMTILFLILSVSGAVSAQSTQMFVVGEISNIGGLITPPADAVDATPTPTPVPNVPSFTTNGQVGSRQLSFRLGLAELGYVEGENLTYVFDTELTAVDTLDTAAQNLVAANVDIIVAHGTTAALAAQRAVVGTDIPVVFVGPVNPVQLGLVKSLQNTEGNITGVGGVSETYAKQLEWLIQLDPTIQTIYLPYLNLTNPATSAPVQAIKEFAEKSGIEVVEALLPTPEDATAAVADLPDVDAIMLVPFAPVNFIQGAIEQKLPLSYAFTNAMDFGPLLSYNHTESALGLAAARYVDRILKGAKPSDLPVEIAANSLAINLRTAEAIGLTISDDILRQADILVR